MKRYCIKAILRDGKFTHVSKGLNMCIEVSQDKKTVNVYNGPEELNLGQGTFVGENKSMSQRIITCRFADDKEDTTIQASLSDWYRNN
jgi:hypothetical protein